MRVPDLVIELENELLVDGFYVQDDSYIAYLQKGIRVPVPKVIYDEYIKGFEKDST